MDQQTIQSSPQDARVKKPAAADAQDTMGRDQRKGAVLAYALYEQRWREELEDWLDAEQRLV